MRYLEQDLPSVKYRGLNTKKAVDFSGAPSVALPSGVTINGSPISVPVVPFALTGTDSSAFAVGQNGSTNPALAIDTSVASSATGVIIASKAAGSGVTFIATSSGSNESLTIGPKGTGNVQLGFNGGGGNVISPLGIVAGSATAITTGGSLVGLRISSTAAFGMFVGSGAPTITAAKGSIYLRSDGSSTSTRLYTSDGGGTWIAVTTAS